ncbi:hypothetical protein DFH27DRAFT_483769 [Peziza echinospora]|nr:hypothetical protein DFH27DRAFT_483769 [Peziza echinospora]
MFRPLTFFSGIPCPSIQAREVCGLGDRCLFLHEDRMGDSSFSSTSSSQSQTSSNSQPQQQTSPYYRQQQSPQSRLFKPAPSAYYSPRGLKRRGSDSGSSRRRVVGTGGSESGSASGVGEGGRGVARKKSKMEVVEMEGSYGAVGGSVGRAVSAMPGGVAAGVSAMRSTAIPAPTVQPPQPPQPVPKPIIAKSAMKAVSAPPPQAQSSPLNTLGAVPPSLTYTNRTARPATATGSNSAAPVSTKAPILVPISIARSPVKWNIRQQLLTLLHGEYLRLYHATATPQDPEIITLAVEEEAEVARTKGGVYPNVMKSRIVALKKPLTPLSNSADTSAPALITDPTLYIPLKTNLTPEEEIKYLQTLIHPPKTLLQYGYILKPPAHSEVIEAEKTVQSTGGYETCDRCQSRFRIYPGRREEDGQLASGGKCRYHWGRALFPPRERGAMSNMGGGGGEKTYSCCSQPIGQSVGCVEAENHVFKVGDTKRLASQWQWESISGPMGPDDGVEADDEPYDGEVGAAFALDCEMCYTTNGMEVVRITIVDFPEGKTVLDALVRPLGEVLDLNTRFSGVSVKQYVNAKTYVPGTASGGSEAGLKIFSSPKEARGEVLGLMREASAASGGGGVVLIGHALDNDLSVLRICHPLVVDTCILYPHSRGFPLRNKLSWAAERFLKWKIQAGAPAGAEDSESLGHDSAIDARCAGELVRWKIKEGKPTKVPGAPNKTGKSKIPRSVGGSITYDGVAGYIQRERELMAGGGGSGASSPTTTATATTSAADSARIAALAAAAVPVKKFKGGFTVDEESDGNEGVGAGAGAGAGGDVEMGGTPEMKQQQQQQVEPTPPQSPPAKRAHHERRTSGLGMGLWGVPLGK